MFCEYCGRDNGESYSICAGCGKPRPDLFGEKQQYYSIADDDVLNDIKINTIDIASELKPVEMKFTPAELPEVSSVQPEEKVDDSLQESKIPHQLEEMLPDPPKRQDLKPKQHSYQKPQTTIKHGANKRTESGYRPVNIPPPRQTPPRPTQPQSDPTAILWGILGFFIPIAGFIVFATSKNVNPTKAQAALVGAIIGVFLCCTSLSFLNVTGS